MTNDNTFLDLPGCDVRSADVVLLPLPYEGTACYGKGTARGPEAVIEASGHVESWDEEIDFDLASLGHHTPAPLLPAKSDTPESYLQRVFEAARELHSSPGLVIGLGGEHSLTPSLVRAAAADPDDLSHLTVVQIDAHSDLRDEYEGTACSHACAMRRVVERGANVIAVGIRSAEREEFQYGRSSGRVQTFFARQLAEDGETEGRLLELLASLSGDVYLTIDIDGLDVALCPGTGTPQPGGLRWWQTLRYLRRLLYDNRRIRFVGCDLVEVVPQPHTQVNEFVAARLLAKVIAYRFAPR